MYQFVGASCRDLGFEKYSIWAEESTIARHRTEPMFWERPNPVRLHGLLDAV